LQIVSLLFVIMNTHLEPIKNWFGFTRRERRSAIILLLIIVLIISVRYIRPGKNMEIEDVTDSFSGAGGKTDSLAVNRLSIGQQFAFDPNTASYDTLMKLGLDAREAKTLINYRNKGGRFIKPADIKKIYGIGEGKAETLISYVNIRSDTVRKERNGYRKKPAILIDLNSSDSASLVRLPGIGPVLSARIIKYRHLLGGFASVNQLTEVYGLSVETFDLIKGRVYADSSLVRKININSSGYKELSRLPYFEKYEVVAILKYRELNGRINTIADLTDNKILTMEKAGKVLPYLRFE
jgi:competence protein ComEA